jgi:hypothetical protein
VETPAPPATAAPPQPVVFPLAKAPDDPGPPEKNKPERLF